MKFTISALGLALSMISAVSATELACDGVSTLPSPLLPSYSPVPVRYIV
jgi:hypothetical protein